jgi:hypothetical protein
MVARDQRVREFCVSKLRQLHSPRPPRLVRLLHHPRPLRICRGERTDGDIAATLVDEATRYARVVLLLRKSNTAVAVQQLIAWCDTNRLACPACGTIGAEYMVGTPRNISSAAFRWSPLPPLHAGSQRTQSVTTW